MAKKLQLKPTRSTVPNTPWRVNVPPTVSASGKRERYFFKTKGEAETFCQLQRTRLENYGRNSTTLAPSLLEQAAMAADRLAPYGVSLNEVVADYIARVEAGKRTVTFKTMFEAFAEFSLAKLRRGLPTSDAYRRQLKYTMPRFSGIHEKMIPEITPADIEQELKGVPASARNALLRVVRAAFNYAVSERQWLKESPIRRSMFVDTGEKQVEILTNTQVCRLILACKKLDPDLLPYHVLGLFAGIRPEELSRLQWENIQLTEKVIRVPASVAKTHYERFIEIEPTLAEWLKFSGTKRSGFIAPQKNMRKRLRDVREKAGIHDWIQDVIRHTYASNWMALHKDEDRCRDNMGHRTRDELQRHYRKHMPLKQAKRYWEIRPKARWELAVASSEAA